MAYTTEVAKRCRDAAIAYAKAAEMFERVGNDAGWNGAKRAQFDAIIAANEASAWVVKAVRAIEGDDAAEAWEQQINPRD